MSTDVLEPSTETSLKSTVVGYSTTVFWQWLFVAGATAICFVAPLLLLNPFFPFYHEFYGRFHLTDTKIVTFLTQLVTNDRLSPALGAFLNRLAGDAYIKDFVHASGGISEGIAILLCLLVPSRLIRTGILTFSVMPPLAFVLLIITCEVTNVPWYCAAFGYLFTSAKVQSLFVLVSCLLFVCRAKLQKLRTTSRADFCGFWIVLIIFCTAVTYFTLRFGNYARLD
jgi:hypothetical protein